MSAENFVIRDVWRPILWRRELLELLNGDRTDQFRDLSNAMSALSVAQNNSLQEQKQREILRAQYNTKAPSSEPLTAPTPTRAPTGPTVAAPGIWSPEMGINFGAPAPNSGGNTHKSAYPNTQHFPPPQKGSWKPNQGIKFG